MDFYYILIIQFIIQGIVTSVSNPLKNNYIIQVGDKIIAECLNNKNHIFIDASSEKKTISFNLKSSSAVPLNLFRHGPTNIFENFKRMHNVFVLDRAHLKNKLFPASSFSIIGSFDTNFTSTLEDIRQSIWWNHNARVLILDNNFNSECQAAESVLKVLWMYNILSAVYLCSTPNNALFLFTFNPYTYLAPKFWNAVNSNHETRKYWTLLNHSFEDKDISLFSNKTGYRRFNGLMGIIVSTLMLYMNATFTIKFNKDRGFIDRSQKPQGALKDVLIEGTVDILMISYYLRDYWQSQVYPMLSDSIKIVSANNINNDVIQFYLIFDVKIWAISLISCFVFITILKCILSQSMSTALLEFIRMFISGASMNQPLNSFKRILFVTCVVAIFVLSTYAQSHLTSLNIVPYSRQYIESLEDLIQSKYDVYGFESYKDIINHTGLLARYHPISSINECQKKILRDDAKTCLVSDGYLKYYNIDEQAHVHISKFGIVERGVTFTHRQDFPLHQKLDWIMSRLKQGGFINFFWYKEIYLHKKFIEQSNVYVPNVQSVLLVGIVLFLGGITLAVLAFLIEYYNISIRNYCCTLKKKTQIIYKRK